MEHIQTLIQTLGTEGFILLGLMVGAGAAGLGLWIKKKPESLPKESSATRSEAPSQQVEPNLTTPGRTQEPLPEKTLAEAMARTKEGFWGRIKNIFGTQAILSSNELEELEEVLYTSDLGPRTVKRLMSAVEESAKAQDSYGLENVRHLLKAEMLQIFASSGVKNSESEVPVFSEIDMSAHPAVWMMVGINGAGKTTTIGKLATLLAENNKKVLLAAGDTFRAAAGEQLKVWTDRAQVEIFHPPEVKDPSAVAFDAIQKGKAKGFDVVIIDTAGRLHTQKNLMEELKKMKRVMAKVMPEAPHETLLVLDANQGQNALIQAKEFHEAIGVTGVVLTKMDGTAKGGVALGVACELQIPIKMVGIGEKPRDLKSFSAKEYIDSIL